MTHEPELPERDPQLSAAWREHATDLPSATMDAAILAAAHRAVKSAPRNAGRAAVEAARPQRWWMPLAAAATIGAVALGILQTMPPQDSITAPATGDAPARTPASAAAAPPPPAVPAERSNVAPPASVAAPAKPVAKVTAPAAIAATDNVAPVPSPMAASSAPQPFPAESKAELAASDAKDRARMAPRLAAAPVAASEVAPAPPAAAAPMPESTRAAARQRNVAQPSAPTAAGAVALGKTAARLEAAAAPAVDVDAWIARIGKLHDEGKLADAAKELTAMRAAVPDADARLPRELRAWAATVKP